MNKFVQFFAEGIIYYRDKKGRPCGVTERRMWGGGVTLGNADLMGKIFMQCPDLLPCDWVEVETCPIG